MKTLLLSRGNQATEIERMQEKHMHAILVLEDVISQRHVRDMEVRRAESNEKARARAGEMIMPMLPLLVNKFAGAPLQTPASRVWQCGQ